MVIGTSRETKSLVTSGHSFVLRRFRRLALVIAQILPRGSSSSPPQVGGETPGQPPRAGPEPQAGLVRLLGVGVLPVLTERKRMFLASQRAELSQFKFLMG